VKVAMGVYVPVLDAVPRPKPASPRRGAPTPERGVPVGLGPLDGRSLHSSRTVAAPPRVECRAVAPDNAGGRTASDVGLQAVLNMVD
jgi:hypothetical protein